jgi:hypothetical protein
MSGITSESTIWVAGEASGKDETGATVDAPTSAFFVSTATAAPTTLADAEGHNVFIASNGDLYAWDGAAWIGPYTT